VANLGTEALSVTVGSPSTPDFSVVAGAGTTTLDAKQSEQVTVEFAPGAAGIDCTDGSNPVAGLIMDGSGNLYGTTAEGGRSLYDVGTVFELTPHAAKTAWTEQVLHSFCAEGGNCIDSLFSA